jgi:hypothetical protein
MTPPVLDRPIRRAAREQCVGGPGRRMTLEQRLDSVLTAAQAGVPADCPVCAGPMVAAGSAAECGSCGSRLS